VKRRSLPLAAVLAGAAAAALVASTAHAQPPSPECATFPCGRVESIRQTTVKQPWTPLGTAAGFDNDARAAPMLQMGPGGSNQGVVLLGAAGVVTNRKSPNTYEQPRWEVTVKLDSGQKRVVTVAYEPFVREGDRVRVAGNSLELLN
jgi:outer membrane lipoprotein SlyB